MLSTVFLMAMVIGQTNTNVPVLSEATRKAHARALAEFRANEHTIKSRLEAHYQLENQRLSEKTATVNLGASRLLYFAAGARDPSFGIGIGVGISPYSSRFSSVPPAGTDGFTSAPPTAPSTVWVYPEPLSLSELQRENFLIRGRLRDSGHLYRQANRLYSAEYPIRYRLAETGYGQR
jgi:hypothetical protein